MPRHASRIALLVVPTLLLACSAGSSDGLTSLSGAYTAGPADGGDMGTESGTEGSEGESAEGPVTTVASADGTSGSDDGQGNPLCCQVGAQAGCDSEETETCVCTSRPTCCQNVWAQECVDLAVACGDPFCSDAPDTDDGTTGEPGVDLECDPDFGFSPQNPAPGVAFTATFTDPVGLTWVGMHAEGPGGAAIDGEWGGVTGSGPFTWSYGYDGLAAGVWTFTFTHRQTENGADLVAGVCQKQI
jgi:hypothetical protein